MAGRYIWRRAPGGGELTREEERFHPWLLLPALDDLAYLGARLLPEGAVGTELPGVVAWRALSGDGHFRYLVSATDGRTLDTAVMNGASTRLGRQVTRLADIGDEAALSLPPEEQYLVATGRTYFRGLAFDDLHRLQFDLETTGLNPAHEQHLSGRRARQSRLFWRAGCAERGLEGPAAEADLIRRLVALIQRLDPDVIENHNLHGFDLPFLARRAEMLGVTLALGRLGGRHAQTARLARLRPLARRRGRPGEREEARGRFTVPGRELIDTLDAVRRYDFAARDLPGHGLKAVARHFGLASRSRVCRGRAGLRHLAGRPRAGAPLCAGRRGGGRGVARLLGGAAFALARMAPRRYERLADAGPATGVLDPLLVRAYLRAGAAMPARAAGRWHAA